MIIEIKQILYYYEICIITLHIIKSQKIWRDFVV